MKIYIHKLQRKENLTELEIKRVMREIMQGEALEEDIKDFLICLNEKGATINEITGAAKILRKLHVPVKTKHRTLLDTCGTGGDQKNSFNISTVAALVVAGAGVAVAKHGNRSVSSRCGSADLLEGMGVNLEMDSEALGKCLDEINLAFLFAQKLHPAMKNVALARKQIGQKTIFNVLGPLINPAQSTHQLMGVYSRELVEPIAHVLKKLGLKRALVVHGSDGLDEVTTTGYSFISEYKGKDIISYEIDPQELKIPRAREEDLRGGDLSENIRITRAILDGVGGPQRDIVVINAAYALYASGKVKNITAGIQKASESIDSGRARDKLQALVEFSHKSFS